LQKGINAPGGLFMIQWPANIPSNVDKYRPVFLDSSNDCLINHSDSFVLTSETQSANVTRLKVDSPQATKPPSASSSWSQSSQKGKDVTLIEMPNETLNEIHADNDSPVEMPVSESRSVQLHAGGAAPPIEMPSPSLVMKKRPAALKIGHEVVPLETSPTLEIGCIAVLARGTVE
jgi:hypothetical protein